MGKRYKIDKITDIFAIPEDKFDDFLVDFKAYYHYGKSFSNLIDTLAAAKGIDAKTVPQHMEWIDDGKHDARLKITTSHPKEANLDKETK